MTKPKEALAPERDCLQCRFGSRMSARGAESADGYAWCAWALAQDDAGDRMPCWAHEVLMKAPWAHHGQIDRAEECPAFEQAA